MNSLKQRMRILIAEDSGPSRLALEKTLDKWGYDIVSCRDGNCAWQELQKPDAPQLAILDWMMPGLSGPEICKRLRALKQEPYTYILLLTSKGLKEDLVEGMESGADDYLTKPFDQQELKVRLRAGIRLLNLQTELLEAREQLRDLAMRDPLTGLWNRRSVLEILQREQVRARREKFSIGILMLDLDHFKSVNDRFGHLAGDEVLREAARRLAGSVRPYDAIGRYGGEEFLVVLPGCEESGLPHRAEAMRQAISSAPIPSGEHRLYVTASFGATVFLPHHSLQPDDLIQLADDALYKAKSLGRNRVVYRAPAAKAV